MVELTYIAGSLAVLFVGYLLLDKFLLSKRDKIKGVSLRVLLFEKVGKDKIFKGFFKAFERYDEKLGSYIMIKGVKKAINGVSNTDYFYDVAFNKALAVCKYSDDDYRVMASLKNEVYFKLEDGVKVPYEEPLGITQAGREAMRFNRDFTKRMQEKRAEKNGFWDKYGQYVMVGAMLIIILMTTAYNTNKWEKASKYMTDKFSENMQEAVEQQSSPAWINNLIESIDRRNDEVNAPPN